MYREYRERVEFFVVYIQEAHAADAWQLPANLRDQVVFTSPKSYEERGELAGTCVRKLGLEMPSLVDGFDNPTERAYTGWPDRLYVIAKDGRVAYKSGPGPFGFKPGQVRRVLDAGGN